METQSEEFKITSKINIDFISKTANEGKYFQKIAVSKKYLIIKENNLLIINKDQDVNFYEETNFETKEILNMYSLSNNTLFYMEPDEIKKIDLENLNQQPKKIIFQDQDKSTLEPSILHLEHIKHKINGMEDSICALFQTAYNQLYFSIKKETKEEKNLQKNIHNCIFLKHLKSNFEFIRSLFFKVYKDYKERHFLCIFILCDQIGYFYKIELSSDKDSTEDAKRKIEDFFEDENENSSKIIYKLEEKCINFFYCYELDNEKKPIKILIGDENFLFRLIDLQSFYDEDENANENFEIFNNFDSPNYLKKKKKSLPFPNEKENKLENENLANDDLAMDFMQEENSVIDFEDENEKNNSFFLETKKFNNETKNFENNNYINSNNASNNQEGKEMILYLNQLVLSYHNKNKMQMGGTNFALNAKLVPEEFKNCFIKQGKILFFFKHSFYCFNIESNSISYAFNSRDIIKDVCFSEEIEEDKKNYHKSYILNNLHLSILKFEIEENLSVTDLNTKEDYIDDAVKIRNFLREQRLCEWCYKAASKRCSGCKQVYYCCIDHQSLDWERHKDYCSFNEKNFADYTIITEELENLLCRHRYDIFNCYKDKDHKTIKKGIHLNFQLIEITIKMLREKYDVVQKFNAGNLKNKLEIAHFIEISKFILEHVANALLLIHGFILNNKKKEAYRIMLLLKRDFEDDINYKNFFFLIPKLYKQILIQDGIIEYDYQVDEKLKIYVFQKSDAVYKQEIFEILLDYLNFYATIAKLYYTMGEFAIYEIYCIHYISILEEVFGTSKKHQYIITNCYFQMANLYVEFDEVTKALELYSQCISRCNYEEEIQNNYNIKIYSYYNSALIYYISDQYSLAKKMLEISLETNRKKNHEIDNEISAVIYETLGEVELEYRKYGEALNYLTKALDLRQKFITNEDKFAIKRITFFINFIYDQYKYEEINAGVTQGNRLFDGDRNKARISSFNNSNLNTNNNTNMFALNNFSNSSLLLSNNNLQFKPNTLGNLNNLTNTKKIENEKESKNNKNGLNNNNKNNNSDEDENAFNYNFTNFFKANMQNLNETYKNLSLKVKPKETDKPESDMLNPISALSLRDEEIEEVEKFFLFMTKLNQEEIEILNRDQNQIEINLPINFSDGFKAKLSYSQKIQLLEMKVLKLRRNIILKDPRGKIEIENLNFEIMQRKNHSKKKIDNVINRYANLHNLEKWVENNVNLENGHSHSNNINKNNFDETIKNDNKRNEHLLKEENNNQSNYNEEKFNEQYNLNQRERLFYDEFKSSLINLIRNNPNSDYEMLSDEDLITIIKNSSEDEIKYWINNPEKVLNNNESNEFMSES